MKKTDLLLAIFSPLFLGLFGMFSSLLAMLVMLILCVIIGIGVAIIGVPEYIFLFPMLLHPMSILWNVSITKEKHTKVQEKNIPNETVFSLGINAFIHSLIILFLTLGIMAIFLQASEINILSTNEYFTLFVNYLSNNKFFTFFILELILTVIISVLPKRKELSLEI